MDDERRKLLFEGEAEIMRFTGGETEYLTWVGKSASVLTATMAACKKLVALAEERKEPFTEEKKSEFERLELFGDLLTLAASAVEEGGKTIDSSAGEALPFPAFEALVVRYVSAHRVCHALWRNRDEQRLLSRPPSGRPN